MSVKSMSMLAFDEPRPTTPPRLSREAFERFALSDPAALERVLGLPDIEPSLLTYAAEAVSLVADPSPAMLSALERLLSHPKPYVREGACYGARAHLDRLREAIERVLREDDNVVIRDIAQDILGDA